MRLSKVTFAFAMALAIGTVGLAGLSMDPSADVSDEQASQLLGGQSNCSYWTPTNCSWSGGSGCSGDSGWSSGGNLNYGYMASGKACGGNCGTISVDFRVCGSGS
jgi:hypothetical protein